METYNDRPVFPFLLNYAQPSKGSYNYDPDLYQIGLGAQVALSRQIHQVKTLDIEAWAESLSEIEKFFAHIRGAACGFWLPVFDSNIEIIDGIDKQSFISKGTDLADRWGQDPCEYLSLFDQNENVHIRHVSNIVVTGQNSLITLDPLEGNLTSTPNSNWSASLLLYVRLASDELEIERIRQNAYSFQTSVIEIPDKYNQSDEAQEVIYLYALGYSVHGNEAWKLYTNWGVNVIGINGKVWQSVPIEHGDIVDDAEGAQTSIRALNWDNCPLADLFPRSEGLPLLIKIYETKWDWSLKKESSSRQLIFDGEIRKPQSEGIEINAACQSGSDLYNRPIPSVIATRICNARFCDSACALDIDQFKIQATVSGIFNDSYSYIEVITDISLPIINWLSLGFIGSQAYNDHTPSKYWEYRAIQDVTDLGNNTYRIKVRSPFRWFEIGHICYLYRGCTKTTSACKSQVKADGSIVDNIFNYQGEPLIPLKNPQANTSTILVNSGKK